MNKMWEIREGDESYGSRYGRKKSMMGYKDDRVDEAYKESDLYKVMNCENELKVYYNSYYQNESAELFEEHEEKRKEEYLQAGGLVKELNDFADNKN